LKWQIKGNKIISTDEEKHVIESKIKETSLTNKSTANITLYGKTCQMFSSLSGTRKGVLFSLFLLFSLHFT